MVSTKCCEVMKRQV